MNQKDFITLLREKYNIDLNPQQQEAVVNIEGPTLLLSVPGGGKTTVIVSRCANMVLNHGINPENILTLTFSRASAHDMKDRFYSVFGSDLSCNIQFSTIHSFCYSVIRDYTAANNRPFPQIIEGNDCPVNKIQILKQIYFEINGDYITEDILEDLQNSISFAKNMLYTPDKIEKMDVKIKNFVQIYNAYEKLKRDERYIDYDDMLTGTYQLFLKDAGVIDSLRKKYQYINVDESQDTSFVQHQIIRLLAYPRNNIFMVGDEDQSIYGFRAAFPEALLKFKETYPGAKILMMERNYRSTQNIVKAANNFIKQNKERYEKEMFTENETGDETVFKHVKDRNEQYAYLASVLKEQDNLSECAVLFRNNISAVALVDYLEDSGIPFYIRDTNIHFFNHWVVNDILAFIRLALNPHDMEAFEQIYYKTGAYLSKDMIEYVKVNQSHDKTVLDTLLDYPQMPKSTKEAVKSLIKHFETIEFLRPSLAIKFIEKEMGYQKYIGKASKEMGFSQESVSYIIDSLKTIASRVSSFNDFFERLSVLNAAMENAWMNRSKNAVVLSTIHSSKGLEFERVYMIDLVDGQFPTAKSISALEEGNRSLMEEEVRLFYVGITRAKKHLELITFSKTNNKNSSVSRFFHKLKLAQAKFLYSEISEGTLIKHIKFGPGVVIRIDEDKDLIVIEFKGERVKLLSLRVCMEEGKIKPYDGSDCIEAVEPDDKSNLPGFSVEELREMALEIGRNGERKELLPQLFLHYDYEVRRRACSAAAKLKDMEITAKIRPCIYAEEPQIRQYALKAILKSRCWELVEDVKKVLETEDKYYNIDLCKKIIYQLG
ncbi:MAG TPA: UvrD-helicase domain-containing protein [Acetivibrio sp.]|nr:UvrD-helicase domain-containing protein [Acetivibrio sp.]